MATILQSRQCTLLKITHRHFCHYSLLDQHQLHQHQHQLHQHHHQLHQCDLEEINKLTDVILSQLLLSLAHRVQLIMQNNQHVKMKRIVVFQYISKSCLLSQQYSLLQ